ncbi:hypothetical protein HK100_004195 [Physocladia obscura]|uniref:Uncharacterized protein n=1 Tax=Physocladia obscura TaxID=109957 RepID=A0AAD5XE01_9FUNG|nr:hypothetical protein HK100_004195 [Physocladia obscura]
MATVSCFTEKAGKKYYFRLYQTGESEPDMDWDCSCCVCVGGVLFRTGAFEKDGRGVSVLLAVGGCGGASGKQTNGGIGGGYDGFESPQLTVQERSGVIASAGRGGGGGVASVGVRGDGGTLASRGGRGGGGVNGNTGRGGGAGIRSPFDLDSDRTQSPASRPNQSGGGGGRPNRGPGGGVGVDGRFRNDNSPANNPDDRYQNRNGGGGGGGGGGGRGGERRRG